MKIKSYARLDNYLCISKTKRNYYWY